MPGNVKTKKYTLNGKRRTVRLYRTWQNLKQRCYNPKAKNWRYYGAYAVQIADEWFRDFDVFRKWMLDNGYRKGLQIDRIDPYGDYTPDNCRLVGNQINTQNRRSTNINAADVIQIRELALGDNTQREIAKMFGVSQQTISRIVIGQNWSNVGG